MADDTKYCWWCGSALRPCCWRQEKQGDPWRTDRRLQEEYNLAAQEKMQMEKGHNDA